MPLKFSHFREEYHCEENLCDRHIRCKHVDVVSSVTSTEHGGCVSRNIDVTPTQARDKIFG